MSTISVIIPTKNRINLLEATLDNILSQTLKPFEIIVVDDQSTDGTVDVLNTKYGERVVCINNPGKGPGAARNAGFAIAKGKYIKFFDSDDLMTLNTLEDQLEEIEKKSSDMVYGPYVHVQQDNQGTWKQVDVILQHKPIPSHKTLRECMVKGFFTIIPACLFRKDFLSKVGPWREDIIAYEDWDYLWRISKFQDNPLHTNKSVVFYRFHGAQTTASHLNNQQRDMDGFTCLTDALKSLVVGENGLSYLDRLLMETKISIILKKLKDIPTYQDALRMYDKPIFKILSLYLRIESKINRIKTKTDWQVMHGTTSSTTEFDRYLSLLN